jgi:hypothetical protein
VPGIGTCDLTLRPPKLCLGGPVVVPVAAGQSPPQTQTDPAWAISCMPTRQSYRLGVAWRYVGLTRDAAFRLAAQRGDTLVPVGWAGHCDSSSDDVFYTRKIALVYDMSPRRRLDLPVWDRVPPSARVVAAERVSGRWNHGWAVPNPFAHH